MNVFIVHHAHAVGPDVDAARPLSSAGRAHATSLAQKAKAAGVFPSAIWHSGKLRSRQTAEAFLVACNPFATFRMVRGLAPDDPVEWMLDALAMEEADVMVVGHMPHLPALAARLMPSSGAFPAHGLVWIERTAAGRYEERLKME